MKIKNGEEITPTDLGFTVELLGTMLNYPRTKKAEILYGTSSDENIKKVDELQRKYYPTY